MSWSGHGDRCAHCAGRLGPADADGARRCEHCGRAVAAPTPSPSVASDRPPWVVVAAVVVLVGLVAGAFQFTRHRYRPAELADPAPDRTTTTTTSPNVPPTSRPSDPIDLPDAAEVVRPAAIGAPAGQGLLVDRRMSASVRADGRVDVTAIAGRPEQDGEVLVRLAADDGRPSVLGVTDLPTGAPPSNRLPVVVGDTTYLRTDTQVLAFAADGRAAWATEPEVPVVRTCDVCSLGVGDTFVTLDAVGRLVGYRASSATPAWTRGFGAAVLGVVTNGEVVVVAHVVDDVLAISAVDARTGAIVRSTAAPCGGGDAAATTEAIVLRRVPGTTAVVVASASSEGRVLCAARLEPQTGAVAWSFRRPGIYGVDGEVLVQDGLLVLQPRGADGTAWIDLADGSYRSAPELATPMAAGGGVVVLTERDSEVGRPTIVALDRDTGRQRWVVAPTPIQIATWDVEEGHVGATGPTEPPVFAVTASTAGVQAISFDSARQRVTVWDLDPATGRANAPRAFGLPDPVGSMDPGWRSAFLLVHPDPDRVVLQAGPWVAMIPLVGTEGSWVWTSV